MKQTIIALIKPIGEEQPTDISNKDFLNRAIGMGTVFSLEDFDSLWNNDEVRVVDYFIRHITVNSSFSES